MLNLKLVCTRKYELERGWKLFFEVPDGDGYEAGGTIIVITKDPTVHSVKEKENIEVQLGS